MDNRSVLNKLGFVPGISVKEYMWGEDVEGELRDAICECIGSDLLEEGAGAGADAACIWWRDGNDEESLSDCLLDASADLEPGQKICVLTPKPGFEGAAAPGFVAAVASKEGLNASTPVSLNSEWNAICLYPFGRGAKRSS
ncbi:MAG: DUF3052 domain-containing protein [Aeriscardovia sp.]|nr:DUF3052 domain-containing protein [Aeriscardovia sp.]